MIQFNYKCVVTKNGNKMYYKRVKRKWKRISNKVGMKAEKRKKKYRDNSYKLPKNFKMDIPDNCIEHFNEPLYKELGYREPSKQEEVLKKINDNTFYNDFKDPRWFALTKALETKSNKSGYSWSGNGVLVWLRVPQEEDLKKIQTKMLRRDYSLGGICADKNGNFKSGFKNCKYVIPLYYSPEMGKGAHIEIKFNEQLKLLNLYNINFFEFIKGYFIKINNKRKKEIYENIQKLIKGEKFEEKFEEKFKKEVGEIKEEFKEDSDPIYWYNEIFKNVINDIDNEEKIIKKEDLLKKIKNIQEKEQDEEEENNKELFSLLLNLIGRLCDTFINCEDNKVKRQSFYGRDWEVAKLLQQLLPDINGYIYRKIDNNFHSEVCVWKFPANKTSIIKGFDNKISEIPDFIIKNKIPTYENYMNENYIGVSANENSYINWLANRNIPNKRKLFTVKEVNKIQNEIGKNYKFFLAGGFGIF